MFLSTSNKKGFSPFVDHTKWTFLHTFMMDEMMTDTAQHSLSVFVSDLPQTFSNLLLDFEMGSFH